jgi:hypothetical protein
MNIKNIMGFKGLRVVFLCLILAGCSTEHLSSNDSEKFAAMSEVMTSASQVTRENAFLRLLALSDTEQVNLGEDMLYKIADTNCLCSQFDALAITDDKEGRTFHLADNYYINFEHIRFSGDYAMSLLVELQYPNEDLRYAILARQRLSAKSALEVNKIRPDKIR